MLMIISIIMKIISGFDELKDEIGPSAEASRDVSRDSSIHRGGSVDVNYDEQDLVKVRMKK